MQSDLQIDGGLVLRRGSRGSYFCVLNAPEDCPIPALRPLPKLWFSHASGDVPQFEKFDVLDMPPPLWGHLILLKTIGEKRRFHYELVGDAIERHNGFPANKKFLADLPLKNKSEMSREFVRAKRLGKPVFSTGGYIGQVDYVRRVFRVIAPYRLDDRRYAFVALVFFTALSGMESRLQDATFDVPAALADLPLG